MEQIFKLLLADLLRKGVKGLQDLKAQDLYEANINTDIYQPDYRMRHIHNVPFISVTKEPD